MAQRTLIALVLATLLVGCLGGHDVRVGMSQEPSDGSTAQRGSGDYWMVWVHGSETKRCEEVACSHVACSIAFDHEVRSGFRAFRHANRSAPSSPRVVVALDVFGEGDCPVAYRHAFDEASFSLRPDHTRIDVEVHDNGTLRVNGGWSPLGKRVRVSYDDGTLNGTVLVENLGAWPSSKIEGPAQ